MEQVKGGGLIVQPFAEEMNKSRLTVSRQAMALSKSGYGVLVLDCFGCGDSEGDFGEARLDTWQSDITLGLNWLNNNVSSSLSIIGVRFGCLLAASILKDSDFNISKLILWQPVHDGTEIFRQLDRLKNTRERISFNYDAPSLSAWEGEEVAGYFIHAELKRQMETLHIVTSGFSNVDAAHLYQVSPFADDAISSKNASLMEAFNQVSIESTFTHVTACQFWNSVETELAETLISETMAHF